MLTLLGMTSLATASRFSYVGNINFMSADYISSTILELHEDTPIKEPINLIITSPGGSVLDGFTIINTIRAVQHEGRKIIITVNRLCASMCFAILQTADVRLSYALGLIMQHKASPSGVVSEVIDRQISEMEAARIGMPVEKWMAIVASDIWLSPKSALAWNVIDGIATPLIDREEEEDDFNNSEQE